MPENARPLMTLESLRSVPLFASLDDEAAGASASTSTTTTATR
jgi:hypothetical protein